MDANLLKAQRIKLQQELKDFEIEEKELQAKIAKLKAKQLAEFKELRNHVTNIETKNHELSEENQSLKVEITRLREEIKLLKH